MDAQLKTKWVEALRSGKYRQTTGNLREERTTNHYGYCCLGVLCKVAGAKWKAGTPVLNETMLEAEGEAYLSYDALKLFGLDDQTQKVLAGKNDEGEGFAEIADYIETDITVDVSRSPATERNDG